ncbi:MAG: hypothetical protein ACI93R_001345 [Flavobacteriales bacterium]
MQVRKPITSGGFIIFKPLNTPSFLSRVTTFVVVFFLNPTLSPTLSPVLTLALIRVLIGVLFSAAILFSPYAFSQTDSGLQFSVKPRLCVLSEKEETCADTLEITWHSDRLRSICLFQSSKQLPLRCWEDENRGEHRVEIITGADVDFQLREVRNKNLLVTQSFEVLHDQVKYRKRRRNPWSFF